MYVRDGACKRTYPTTAALITLFSTPPLDETCGTIFHRFVALGVKSPGVGSGGGLFLRLVRFCIFGAGSSSPLLAASDLTLRFRFVGRGLSSESRERALRARGESGPTRGWAVVMIVLRAACFCFVVEAMLVAILELLLRAMVES